MRDKNIAICGIYSSRSEAAWAVDALKNAGFRTTDIAVLLPDNPGTKDFGLQRRTKAPEGATIGGLAGGVVGGTLGFLVAIAIVAVPGLDPVVAAGPILGTLAGLGAGGSVGTLGGFLIGLAFPEYEAKRFEGRVRKGCIFLSVHCDRSDWTKRAKAILDQTGAEKISAVREAKADFATSDRPMRRVVHGPSEIRDTDPAFPPRTPAANAIYSEADDVS